jgi:P4 family phage/plasmid primase-like protien
VIQILALREGSRPGKKTEVWFEKGLRAPSVESLFADPYEYIKRVENSERWNVYYTVADCLEEPGRKLQEQHHIPFDVDGLVPHQSPEQLQIIARVICDAIGVPFDKVGVIFSGHGLQVIVGTTTPILSVDEFDRDRLHYKAICDRIDLRLIQAKIVGKSDRSVWSPARLMRYPLTENRKPDKGLEPVMGLMLNPTIERLAFTVREASGIPDVPTTGQIARSIADGFATPDTKAILDPTDGCKFLAWCQTHPEDVTEPEWYAMVSITARLDEGRRITHKMSQGHPGYSEVETDQKITQALESSGPRTCKNIDALSSKCMGCKWNGSKLVSPILIEGPDHIKTEKTGFRKVFVDPETGIVTRKSIDLDGLVRFYGRKNPYIVLRDLAQVWAYNGQFFERVSDHTLWEFAHINIDPKPQDRQRRDFAAEVKVTEIAPRDFFTHGIEGLMNFSNGVYDVRNAIFHEHSIKFGFRSVLPCAYDPKATAPRFMKFLDEVTLGRPELIEVLQEFLGYIFANEECRYGKALVLVGEGSNGKSTLMEVVRALAGKKGSSSLSVKAMQNDQKRAMMEGNLVNIAEENSRDSFRDTELIKNFVTGGMIDVKTVYEAPYEYANKTKLVMLCNELPRTSDLTHGFLRRCLIVPFDATFDRANRDINIKDALLAELPGIFNWIIEGYKRLTMQGHFTDSKVVQEQLEAYRLDNDPVLQFVTDECEIDATDETGDNTAKLYEDYTQWAKKTGVPQATMTKFVRDLHVTVNKVLGLPKETDLKTRVMGPDGKKHRKLKYIRSLYQTQH